MEGEMKCVRCGSTDVTAKRENFQYTASGLSNVVLEDVEVRYCTDCGDRAAAIPRIEELHRQIGLHLCTQGSRLAPEEIRFLRKMMDWTGAEFARRFGVAPETVSRWETGSQEMGSMAETLLRVWVVLGEDAKEIAIEVLEKIGEKEPARARPIRAALKKNWKLAAA